MKISFWVILMLLGFSVSYSQDNEYYNENPFRYEDYVYKNNIQTVLLYKEGWELSYPIITLNNPGTLILKFDDLSDDVKDYSYTIIHCSSDWQPSSVSTTEYIDGFMENRITDYRQSFNTTYKYNHYTLSFPNEELKIKISGNYILKVFENFDQENVVLTRRFLVVDQKLAINANVKQSAVGSIKKTNQEVDFTINKNNYSVNNVYEDIKVFLMQNFRWDNSITKLKPQYVKDDELIYDFDEENTFPGGSEFRYFDMKSLRFSGEYIDKITYKAPYYHVKLMDDEKWKFKTYQYHKDINGKFLIQSNEAQESNTEADYAYVYFSLKADKPFIEGNLYVYGALSDWSFTKPFLMKYNSETSQYELSLLLKQGYYNYCYAFVKDKTNFADTGFIEGNHWETENDYVILVYHKDFTCRYEKLIGYQIVNSVVKNK